MPTGPFSDTVILCASPAQARVPGYREEDMGVFLNPKDFGQVAIWTRQSGGDQVALRCIFDAESSQVDPDTGQVYTTQPQAWVSTADVVGLARNDRFEFCGIFYRVKEIEPDGTGLTVVQLTKDKAS